MTQGSPSHIQDIITPEKVSFWPPQPGWYLVLLFVLILISVFIAIWIRNTKRNAYRKQGILALEALKNKDASDSNIIKVNSILKACALQAYTREDIAILSGVKWVDFLNTSAKNVEFTGTYKTILSNGPYKKLNIEDINQIEFNKLLSLSIKWIENHRHH